MFVPLWLVYLGTGTLMAVLTLVWAMRSRQFEDQDRARFLPLAGLEAEAVRPARRASRVERWAIVAVLACGALALLSTLAVVLRHV